MTGCLLAAPATRPMEKHTHVVFRLEEGKELRFSDTRRFGRFWLIRNGEEDTFSGLGKLGPEPFDAEFTVSYLQDVLCKKKRAVKDCLLDQSIVAGVGNIYADEILFAARVRPDRPANSLKAEECGRLARLIPEILSCAIRDNEISAEEYLAGKGQEYRSAPFFKVYGHEGGPCPVCGRRLCRIVIAGRSSVYCPDCQGRI